MVRTNMFKMSGMAALIAASLTGEGFAQVDDIERDKLILGLANALKAEDYPKAVKRIVALNKMGVEMPAPVLYFFAEARYHTCRPTSAVVALKGYLRDTGKEGRYYKDALNLLLKIEDQDPGDYCRAYAKEAHKKAKDYLTSNRFSFGVSFKAQKGGKDKYTFKTGTYLEPDLQSEKTLSCYLKFKQEWKEQFAPAKSPVTKGNMMTLRFWETKSGAPSVKYAGPTKDKRFYKYNVIKDYRWRDSKVEPIILGTLYSRIPEGKIGLKEINGYLLSIRNACGRV